ncbi:MAG: glycosyltransferase [candidate division KSB1 bacterium]|nr:glycosyltransferase [candidate division KSB1 bacterium]MDZ7335473.1 glycosyltransferase [candidate division KSB1 bacterium]MDZ7357652.1 glycosyltransferase [candidate division KSB1 bacterium]MDZ7399204.1 glycosyltransferase [candidate division KSB1 bacterium]
MGKSAIRVLHLDTELNWRGGQQQAAYLIEAMHRSGYATAMVGGPNSAIGQFCQNKGIPFFPLRILGEGDVIAGRRVAALCRRHGFRILHLHSSHALSIGLWAKLFLRSLKLIAVRRVDFHIQRNWLSRLKYRHRWLDRIVCISEAIRQVLLQDGIPSDKLVTIHSGVDLHKFDQIKPSADFRAQFNIPVDHMLIGTVAAMAGHKDYPTLLRAAKIVCNTLDHVTFCAVGDGSQRDKILQLHRELGLGQRFVLPGYRTNIGDFFKNFDIFVLASKQEGLGTSLLDAQALGLPVIACRSGGIPEIIEHGYNGWLVPAQDETALASALITLINDPALRIELGKNALRSVKKFDIAITVKNNLKLYQTLLSE